MRHILKDGCITNKFPAKPDTIPDGINCRRPGKHEAQGICPGCKKKERSGVRYGKREKKDMDLPPDSRHRGDSDRSDLLLQRAAETGNRRLPDQGAEGGILCLLTGYFTLKETGT